MGCPSGYTASPTPPLNNGVHTTLIRQKSGGGDITGPMARFAHISRPQCRIPSANSRRRRRQLVLARRSERRSRRFRRTFSSALDAQGAATNKAPQTRGALACREGPGNCAEHSIKAPQSRGSLAHRYNNRQRARRHGRNRHRVAAPDRAAAQAVRPALRRKRRAPARAPMMTLRNHPRRSSGVAHPLGSCSKNHIRCGSRTT